MTRGDAGAAEPPELIALRLTLRPLREGWLLPGSGRAVQAWLLDTLRAQLPTLAERLHAGSERRPYACSPVFGLGASRPGTPAIVSPQQAYTIRLSAWDAELSVWLAALAAGPPPLVTLGDVPFAVERAAIDPDAPAARFGDLAAWHLLPAARGGRPADVTLHFLSATAFRQAALPAGRPAPVPFPLPALVWPGLFDRWQAASAVQLEAEVREALGARVAVSRFEGRSERVLLPGLGDAGRASGVAAGRWVVGYVGRCAYWCPREDAYLAGVLRLLAAFASYAGAGHGTTHGLGQARWQAHPRHAGRRATQEPHAGA